MNTISPSLSILKKTIRYFFSIAAISYPVCATEFYIKLDKKRVIEERDFPTLSNAQKYQCLDGINSLSEKIALSNRKKDSIPSSFVNSDNAIAFPAEDGKIIIVQKKFPFKAKKFSSPKDQGIYEFEYNKDSFAFSVNGTSKCASTKPISECGNSKPQHRSMASEPVSEKEISKYIYNSISELNGILTETKKVNPSFSYLSTEMKVCVDAFKPPKEIAHTNDFQKTLRLLDSSDFYAGGVGGSAGGTGPSPAMERNISSENSAVIKE